MKRTIILFISFVICLSTYSQSISVDSIVAFYRNADIDCYKEKLYKGMKEYDCWLEDTFPKIIQSWYLKPVCLYSPSNIDIRKYDVIPFVALSFYDMENFSEKDNIYDHIIIDSTRCFSFVPIDKKGTLLGITEMYDHYTYVNFTNKEDYDYKSFRKLQKHLKRVLKTCRKNDAEALVFFQNSIISRFCYIKKGRIYFATPKPEELNEGIFRCLEKGHSDMIRVLGNRYLPEYRELYKSELDEVPYRKVRTGHTERKDLRICM